MLLRQFAHDLVSRGHRGVHGRGAGFLSGCHLCDSLGVECWLDAAVRRHRYLGGHGLGRWLDAAVEAVGVPLVEHLLAHEFGVSVGHALAWAVVFEVAHGVAHASATTGHHPALHDGLGDGVGHLLHVVAERRVGVEAHARGCELVGGELAGCGQHLTGQFFLDQVGQEADQRLGGLATGCVLDRFHVALEAELLADHLEGCEDGCTGGRLRDVLPLGAAVAVLLAEGLQGHASQRDRFAFQLHAGNHQRQLLGDAAHRALEVALHEVAALADGGFLAADLVAPALHRGRVFVSAHRVGDELIHAQDGLADTGATLDHTTHERVVQAVGGLVGVEQLLGVEVEVRRLSHAAEGVDLLAG